MVKRAVTLLAVILIALPVYALAGFESDIANNQQSAIAEGMEHLDPQFLKVLTGVDDSAPKSGFSEEPYQLGTSNSTDQITFKILVSDAMGRSDLIRIFDEFAYRDDVTFYIRGFLPQERTFNDIGMRIINLVRDLDHPPRVNLDTRPFYEVEAQFVPQTLMYKGDELVMSASGIANPSYLTEQYESGKYGDLGILGSVVEINEIYVEDVIKERIAKLDKKQLIKDAKDNYWKNIQFLQLPLGESYSQREFTQLITSHEDITDGKGNYILSGELYNSLDVMPFTLRLVVFDPTDEAQMEYVKNLPPTHLRTKYIATRFDRNLKWDAVKSVERELNAPVYQLKTDLINAFDLKVSPTLVTADNMRKVFILTEGMPNTFQEKEYE